MPTFCDDVPHSHNAADDSQAALYSSCAAAAVAGVVPGQLQLSASSKFGFMDFNSIRTCTERMV